MTKERLLELDLVRLTQPNLIRNTEYRFIDPGFSMVISFAKMESSLLKIGQPYRIKEGRIMRSLTGNAKVAINLIEYDIAPRNLIIVPPNAIIQAIDYTDDFDFQAIVYNINTTLSLQKENEINSQLPYNTIIELNDKEWEITNTYFSLLWDTLHESEYQREVIHHLVSAFLYNIKYYAKKQKQYDSNFQPSRQQELFRHFIALVNEHSRKERNVKFYADRLCLTPRYLNTLIRQISQQTVMAWINQAVTTEAQVLLKHSDLLIYQIADELHFPNSSFFCKFFKRMTGMTPQEYQKQ